MTFEELEAERDALKAENESFRKNYVTRLAYNAVQSELTKARELLKEAASNLQNEGYEHFPKEIFEFLAYKSATAEKGGEL
jgi:hypothetical protein